VSEKQRDKILGDAVSFRQHLTETSLAERKRKGAEREQKSREAREAKAFRRFPLPAALCRVLRNAAGDAQDIEILDANRALAGLLDAESRELSGKSLFERLAWVKSPVLRLLREQPEPPEQKTIQPLEGQPGEWWRVIAGLVGADDILLVFQNVTSERRETDSLSAENRLCRDILQTEEALVCRYGSDGTVTYANEAYRKAFGRQGRHLLAHSFVHDIHPDDRELVARAHKTLKAASPSVTYVHRIGSDDNWEWFEWTDIILIGPHGVVEGYQATGHRITHLKSEETALRSEIERLQKEVRAAPPQGGRSGKIEIRNAGRTGQSGRGQQPGAQALQIIVCEDCKRVLDEREHWIPLDAYLDDHAGVKVRGGLCPYCKRKNYPTAYRA
jgi:PAS domain S-box-containing protein